MAFCPPEAIFEPKAPLSYSADVWSLATAIWEILGMKVVFSTDVPYDEVIAHWMDVLGPMPWERFEKWDERGRFFDESRRAVEGRYVWANLEGAFEECVRVYRRKHKMGDFNDDEMVAILELMRGMLKFRPEERLTVEEVLRSEWMVKWVMPDYERSLQTST